MKFPLILAGLLFALLPSSGAQIPSIHLLDVVPADGRTGLYPSNRAPLSPSPLLKLPLGSITPEGWLRRMLELERDGMAGHLAEISPWLDFSKSSWADPQGRGHFGWEEMPYWLKGYGDLAYVLKDPAMMAQARRWIEAALASQQEDGYFGPRELLTSLDKKSPDMWPHMLMLNVLQSFYEETGDDRVLPAMTRYFHWQDGLPPADFNAGYWPRLRMGDNLESIYWLYNRTGDEFLLTLAKKIFENSARWDQDVVNWHNVNIAQGFRTPAIYWMADHRPELLAAAERNYTKVMGLFGQFPGGGFAGDENCRAGYGDPRQGFETCGMVEFMHSFEMLTKISGAALWSDRCEDVAFNSLPAAMTPDQKALHYLTCANVVQLDSGNKARGIDNGGTMFSYSPYEVYRCCQHNHVMGWPYYAEELWLATADRGLCASLYAPSEVTARVAGGQSATFTETTRYPFGETVRFDLKRLEKEPADFPLYLRVPGWCRDMKVSVNGTSLATPVSPTHSGYLVIDRTWKAGDFITATLPMAVETRRWPKNHDSVSIQRGPLTYALNIDEKQQEYGNRDPHWPQHEVYAASPWNYGLVLPDQTGAAKAIQVVARDIDPNALPFTPESSPLELETKARRIEAWKQDNNGLLNPLQASPAKTDAPIETIHLIPMGAARLRISAFPTTSDSAQAHAWVAPGAVKPMPFRPTASHCFALDSLDALCDGVLPSSSHDSSLPRMTWWDHTGTTEWVQYDLGAARQVLGARVYWYDDTGQGRCRPPKSWRILYQAGGQWLPVTPGGANLSYGTALDQMNDVSFAPVQTAGLRLEAQLAPDFSAGILEWEIR